MRLENKTTEINQGDLVKWHNDGGSDIICVVTCNTHSDFPWIVIDISDFEVVDAYARKHDMLSHLTLIAKENKLKLVVED